MKKISLLLFVAPLLLAGCATVSLQKWDVWKIPVGTGEQQNCPKGLIWNATGKICSPDFSVMIKQQIQQQEKIVFSIASGAKKETFSNEVISFDYQKTAKTGEQLVEKNEPVKWIYKAQGGRPVIEFWAVDISGMKFDEYLKMRYMVGADMQDKDQCTITQTDLANNMVEVKITPSDVLLTKYATDPGMSHRLCGEYSVVNNMVFIYKKDAPSKFIIVEKSPRSLIDISSIILK